MLTWPTPNAGDDRSAETPETWQRRADACAARGANRQLGLRVAVQMDWPTPRVSMANGPSQSEIDAGDPKHRLETAVAVEPEMWPTATLCGNYNRKGASATSGDGLATAVSQDVNWPTPSVGDTTGGRVVPIGTSATGRRPDGAKTQIGLQTAVRSEMMSTPAASMFNDSEDPASFRTRQAILKAKHTNGNGAGTPLAVQVKESEWSTPTAHDAKHATLNRNTDDLAVQSGAGKAAPLNADWVGCLMGFPLGWTDVPAIKNLRPKKQNP